MTAVEILSSFRSMSREEKMDVMSNLVVDLRKDVNFSVIDGVMFSKPLVPLVLTEAEREESRRRVAERHLATPAEDFLKELESMDFESR